MSKPTWARFIARSMNGEWFYFENRPLLNDNKWTCVGQHAPAPGQMLDNVAWFSSCRELNTANERQVGGQHYKQMGIQVWDVVDTWPLEQRIGYYRGNSIKYLMRMGSKDESPQEIAKGQHYVEKLLEVLKEVA